MACVPPGAGIDASRKLSIAQGVHSNQFKMKQALLKSCWWRETHKNRSQIWHARSKTSQAIVEEMEANEEPEKKSLHCKRWQASETMVLIALKKQKDEESAEMEWNGAMKARNKWKEIEALCQEKGIERTAEQCKTRWSRLISAYTRIRSWETTRSPEQLSFWLMKLDERKNNGFVQSLDWETYKAMDEAYRGRTDAIHDVFVENDGNIGSHIVDEQMSRNGKDSLQNGENIEGVGGMKEDLHKLSSGYSFEKFDEVQSANEKFDEVQSANDKFCIKTTVPSQNLENYRIGANNDALREQCEPVLGSDRVVITGSGKVTEMVKTGESNLELRPEQILFQHSSSDEKGSHKGEDRSSAGDGSGEKRPGTGSGKLAKNSKYWVEAVEARGSGVGESTLDLRSQQNRFQRSDSEEKASHEGQDTSSGGGTSGGKRAVQFCEGTGKVAVNGEYNIDVAEAKGSKIKQHYVDLMPGQNSFRHSVSEDKASHEVKDTSSSGGKSGENYPVQSGEGTGSGKVAMNAEYRTEVVETTGSKIKEHDVDLRPDQNQLQPSGSEGKASREGEDTSSVRDKSGEKCCVQSGQGTGSGNVAINGDYGREVVEPKGSKVREHDLDLWPEQNQSWHSDSEGKVSHKGEDASSGGGKNGEKCLLQSGQGTRSGKVAINSEYRTEAGEHHLDLGPKQNQVWHYGSEGRASHEYTSAAGGRNGEKCRVQAGQGTGSGKVALNSEYSPEAAETKGSKIREHDLDPGPEQNHSGSEGDASHKGEDISTGGGKNGEKCPVQSGQVTGIENVTINSEHCTEAVKTKGSNTGEHALDLRPKQNQFPYSGSEEKASHKGEDTTIENQRKNSNTRSEVDDDVFMYVQAAISNVVRSVSEAFRKLIKF